MAHPPHDPPSRDPGGAGAAAHASADDEYSLTPPGAGYEHTDANVWIIVKFGLWLAISAAVIHVGMWLAFALFVQLREGAQPEFPLALGQERRLPTGARLQPIPVNEILQFRIQEESVLQNYRWIDRDGGRVQIPISEAMRLTVERGLPSRAQDQPDAPTPATSGLLPSDSSAGRTMERRRQ
jgi:hypothetical protein